jgi:uncharacterized protein YdeI (YjbR/CyaY-like superfamily)
MGGCVAIPLRRSNREAAGLGGGETIPVTIELDREIREVAPPADFLAALQATFGAWDRWRELSYSHQREYVDAINEARRPETRERRVKHAVSAISARSAKKRK